MVYMNVRPRAGTVAWQSTPGQESIKDRRSSTWRAATHLGHVCNHARNFFGRKKVILAHLEVHFPMLKPSGFELQSGRHHFMLDDC